MRRNEKNTVLLNTTDVTELLGFSYWTVQKLIRNRQIRAFKINGRWKIPLSSVESFILDSEDESISNMPNISLSNI